MAFYSQVLLISWISRPASPPRREIVCRQTKETQLIPREETGVSVPMDYSSSRTSDLRPPDDLCPKNAPLSDAFVRCGGLLQEAKNLRRQKQISRKSNIPLRHSLPFSYYARGCCVSLSLI